jgi:gas vesicle protein
MSDRMYMNDTESGNGGMSLGGFLLGAVVGAGLALLLAPATGGETRKKLGETARRIGDRASELKNRVTETESPA